MIDNNDVQEIEIEKPKFNTSYLCDCEMGYPNCRCLCSMHKKAHERCRNKNS